MNDMDLTENEGLRRQKLTQLVRTLMLRELTQPQREIFAAYHYRGKNMSQIAQERGVNISTVSRTLKRAERRIGEVLKYYPQ